MKQIILLVTVTILLFSACKKEDKLFNSITMYNASDGLPSNWIWCITEDHSGNIWIGTDEGVCKYNGIHWQTYFDTLSINKRVENIIVDNSGNIWIDYLFDFDFLYKYNGSILEKISDIGELYNNLPSDCNYLDLGRSIIKYTGNGFSYLDIPLINDDYCQVNDALVDRNCNVWISMHDCQKGVTKFDGINWIDYLTADLFDNDFIGNSTWRIIESKNGNILFSAGTSIIQYDGNNWSIFLDFIQRLGELVISFDFIEDSKGDIWFGYEKLYKFNGSTIREIDLSSYPTEGMYSRVINAFFEDSEGNMWIGTGNGIFQIQ